MVGRANASTEPIIGGASWARQRQRVLLRARVGAFKLMNVKCLRLRNQFVARDAVQVFEQLLSSCTQQLSARAPSKPTRAARSMLVTCDGIRYHVNGPASACSRAPSGAARRCPVQTVVVARHHEWTLRLLCRCSTRTSTVPHMLMRPAPPVNSTRWPRPSR